jgi:hypothetical protein
MLDYVEDYWAYTQDRSGPPPPLPDASAEHKAFTSEVVKRYEFMKQRVLHGNGADRAKGFQLRENDDRRTAKWQSGPPVGGAPRPTTSPSRAAGS